MNLGSAVRTVNAISHALINLHVSSSNTSQKPEGYPFTYNTHHRAIIISTHTLYPTWQFYTAFPLK